MKAEEVFLLEGSCSSLYTHTPSCWCDSFVSSKIFSRLLLFFPSLFLTVPFLVIYTKSWIVDLYSAGLQARLITPRAFINSAQCPCPAVSHILLLFPYPKVVCLNDRRNGMSPTAVEWTGLNWWELHSWYNWSNGSKRLVIRTAVCKVWVLCFHRNKALPQTQTQAPERVLFCGLFMISLYDHVRPVVFSWLQSATLQLDATYCYSLVHFCSKMSKMNKTFVL